MKKVLACLLSLAILAGLMPTFYVAAATDETNFEPVTLRITATGTPGSGVKRLVADATVLPFTVTREGQLEGCLLNGTITYTGSVEGYSKTIPFVDVPLRSAPVRDSADKINLDFVVPDGYTIEMENQEHNAGKYSYNLTLSPAPAAGKVTVYNFEPFKIRFVTRGASTYGKRIVIKNDFPFDVSNTDTLKGCLLNGTVTYTGPDDYSPTVPFVDVEVKAQPIRNDGNISLDFTVPDGYTIKGENDQAEYFTWDLTISPKPAPEGDVPQEGTTFFVVPDNFKDNLGTWSIESNGGYTILYSGQPETKTDTFTGIVIPETGTYNIYSYTRDFATNAPGSRFARISVNGTTLTDAGKHGMEGYQWEKIGEMTLTKDSVAEVRFLSTSGSHSRTAAIMFTTLDDYLPAADKLNADVELYKAESAKLNLSVSGTHLYLPAAAFASDMGDWRTEGTGISHLFSSNNKELQKPATALIEVPKDGTYYVWGYAKDYTSNSQGSRHAKIGINGTVLENKIGQHGATEDTGTPGSYGWTLAGKVVLKAGRATVSVHDTSFNYARVKAVLLTTDEAFTGFPQETTGNATDYPATIIDGFIDISNFSSYGNKVSYTLKNRTDTAIAAGARVITTLYSADGTLADTNITTLNDGLGAKKSTDQISFVMSPTSEWATGKVMVWESLGKFNPLRDFLSFEFQQEDYANPDDNAGANFGTVSSYMLDYEFAKDIYANEYYNRDGLSNTLLKLQNGEDVTIAYLGGSITEQNTWRTYTTKWFEDTYTGKVNEVNIGLSGTGAELAVCRIDQDILVHNPDLIFIEYAVNGGAAKDMEGMVRKVWEHDPTTDICFVYTTTTSNYSVYAQGNVHEYARVYDEVAEYYGVPSVYFGKQAFDLYDQGKLTLSGSKEEGKILYTTDGIHPTVDGGWLAAGAIARSVVNMEKIFDKATYTETAHVMPEEYFDEAPWVNAASSTDWSKMKFEGTWMDCSLDASGNFQNFEYTGGYLNQFKKLFPTMQGTKVPGSSVTVKFRGTDIGVFEAGGQYSGQLRVIVDGVELTKKLVLYHASYDSKLRHQYYFIDSLPYGEHTVTFILDSEMPDKSALQNKNPNDTLYERNEFYLGRILLNGELLDVNE